MIMMLNGPPHTIAHGQTRGGDSRGGTVSFCFYPIDRSREVPERLCPLTTQLSHSPALKRAFQTEFPELGGQIPSYLFFWSRFSVLDHFRSVLKTFILITTNILLLNPKLSFDLAYFVIFLTRIASKKQYIESLITPSCRVKDAPVYQSCTNIVQRGGRGSNPC